MKTKRVLGAMVLATITAACSTSLEVVKIEAGDFSNKGTGVSYYLPQQALRIAVNYTVEACKTGTKDVATISRRAAISTRDIVDGSTRFVVPVSSLQSRFKATSLTVGTYDDGTLKSLGATVDDRSAEAISGFVGTAASIARAVATGMSTEAVEDPKPSNEPKCSDEVAARVINRDQLIRDLRDPLKLADEDARAAAVDRLARLNASLQVTRNITYVPNRSANLPRDRVSREFDSSASTRAVLNEWLTKGDGNPEQSEDNPEQSGDNPEQSGDNLLRAVTAYLAITVCIHPASDGGATLVVPARGCAPNSLLELGEAGDAPTSGLVYRDPRRVRVVVCGDNCRDGAIGQAVVPIAQLGDWRTVELESKAFQDRNAMASWTKAGQLKSLTIGSSSSLEAIAGALNTSAKTAREAISEIVTTDLERLTTEVATVKAEADLLEQRARLIGLQMAPETENEDDGV